MKTKIEKGNKHHHPWANTVVQTKTKERERECSAIPSLAGSEAATRICLTEETHARGTHDPGIEKVRRRTRSEERGDGAACDEAYIFYNEQICVQ